MLASPTSKFKPRLTAYVMDQEPGLFAHLSGHANPHWFVLADGVWGAVEEWRPSAVGGSSWTLDPWGAEPRCLGWSGVEVLDSGYRWWTHPRTVWGAVLFAGQLVVVDEEGVWLIGTPSPVAVPVQLSPWPRSLVSVPVVDTQTPTECPVTPSFSFNGDGNHGVFAWLGASASVSLALVEGLVSAETEVVHSGSSVLVGWDAHWTQITDSSGTFDGGECGGVEAWCTGSGNRSVSYTATVVPRQAEILIGMGYRLGSNTLETAKLVCREMVRSSLLTNSGTSARDCSGGFAFTLESSFQVGPSYGYWVDLSIGSKTWEIKGGHSGTVTPHTTESTQVTGDTTVSSSLGGGGLRQVITEVRRLWWDWQSGSGSVEDWREEVIVGPDLFSPAARMSVGEWSSCANWQIEWDEPQREAERRLHTVTTQRVVDWVADQAVTTKDADTYSGGINYSLTLNENEPIFAGEVYQTWVPSKEDEPRLVLDSVRVVLPSGLVCQEGLDYLWSALAGNDFWGVEIVPGGAIVEGAVGVEVQWLIEGVESAGWPPVGEIGVPFDFYEARSGTDGPIWPYVDGALGFGGNSWIVPAHLWAIRTAPGGADWGGVACNSVGVAMYIRNNSTDPNDPGSRGYVSTPPGVVPVVRSSVNAAGVGVTQIARVGAV